MNPDPTKIADSVCGAYREGPDRCTLPVDHSGRHAKRLEGPNGSSESYWGGEHPLQQERDEAHERLRAIAEMADPDGGPDCSTCVRILVVAVDGTDFLTAAEAKRLRTSKAWNQALEAVRSGDDPVNRAETAEARMTALEEALRDISRHPEPWYACEKAKAVLYDLSTSSNAEGADAKP